jgi:hypothetical protein
MCASSFDWYAGVNVETTSAVSTNTPAKHIENRRVSPTSHTCVWLGCEAAAIEVECEFVSTGLYMILAEAEDGL